MKIIDRIVFIIFCFFILTGNLTAQDRNKTDGEKIIVAAGIGDLFNTVKESVQGVYEGVTGKDDADQNDPTASLEPPAAGHPPLTRDDKREVQRLLSSMGYDPGPADGLIGKGTRSAISTYQADSGLNVTGNASPALLYHLRNSQGSSASTSGQEPIEIQLGNNLRARERQLYYACAEEINKERRRERIAEIKLLSPKQAQTKKLSESTVNAMMGVAQNLGLQLFGSPGASLAAQYAKVGQAAATQAAQQNAIAKIPDQQAALQELQMCVAKEARSKYGNDYFE